MNVVAKWQRLVEDQQALRLLVVLVSLLWSAVVLLQNPVLNDDAYGYLRAALLFREEGLAAVFDRYGWYGYSVLIGVLDAGLPGGVKAAAHVLNAALLALLVLAFVDCAALLQPAPRTRLLAAGILLFPLLNEMRFYVVRDFGFWAFTLLSLCQLERQRRQPGWWLACGWCLALLAATLFRLEALLLAAFTPLGTWRGADWRARAQPYVVLVLMASLLLLLAQLTGADLPARLQYAYRFYLPPLGDLPATFAAEAEAVITLLYSAGNFPRSADFAYGVVLLALNHLVVFAANLIEALGTPLTLLLAVGLWRGWLRGRLQGVWAAYWQVSALSLFVFLCLMHFLTQRYATLLCLLLLVWLPTLLQQADLALQQTMHPRRWRLAGGLVLALLAVDSLFSFGHSQDYLQQAVAWTRSNLPPGQTLLTNNRFVAFESGRMPDFDQPPATLADTLRLVPLNSPLVVVLKAGDDAGRQQLADLANLQLLACFANRRGDEARVYHVNDPALPQSP